jgi:hypothetical protein
MPGRSQNLLRKHLGSTEPRLDARAMMDELGKYEEQKAYVLSFRRVGDRIVASNSASKSIHQARF